MFTNLNFPTSYCTIYLSFQQTKATQFQIQRWPSVILYVYNIYVSTKLRVYNGGHRKMEFPPRYSKESPRISASQLLSAFSPRAGPRFLSAVKLITKEINSFIPASVRLRCSFPEPQRNTWNIALIKNITDLSRGIESTSDLHRRIQKHRRSWGSRSESN